MKIAILIASRNRPDLIEPYAKFLGQNVRVDADWILVEAGTAEDKLTSLTTVHYEDEDFSGFCLAHAVGMEQARKLAKEGHEFDYYWILTHDLEFEAGTDPVAPLIEAMEEHPQLAVLAHTRRANVNEDFTQLDPTEVAALQRTEGGWRQAVISEPTGFLIRAEAVEECGFLNSVFRYGAGAMPELCFALHRVGWLTGYSDDSAYRHAGETTYGVEGTATIAADELERRARRFAYMYFLRICGPGWSAEFTAEARKRGLETEAYEHLRRRWARAFGPDEISDLHAACLAAGPVILPEPATAEAGPENLTPQPTGMAEDDAPNPQPVTTAEAAAQGGPQDPWPLSTEAPRRLLAWPRYEDASDLEALLATWGDALIDQPERCLCLRLDPDRDPHLETAAALLQETFDRVVGPGRALEVLFVDNLLGEADLPRLGLAVDGFLDIPGCDDPERLAFAQAVGAPHLSELHELLPQG